MRILATLFLLTCPLLAGDLGDSATSWLTVAPAGQPPTVDGELAAGEWSSATPLTGFGAVRTHQPLAHQPVAWLTRDPQRLYVAVQVPLAGRAPVAIERPRDGAVWEDDAVEVFLDPGHSQQTYYQLIVSAAGCLYDGQTRDAAWNGHWQAATRRTAAGWSCELGIPFDELGGPPAANAVWGFNLGVDQPGGSATWARLESNFHEPARFGHLRFGDLPAGVLDASGWLLGGDLKISAPAAATVTAQLDDQPLPARRSGETVAVTMALPREGRFARPGRYGLRLEARRPGEQQPLLRWVAEREVRPPLELKVRAFVSEGKLAVEATVDAPGTDRATLACRFTIGPPGGPPVVEQLVPVAAGLCRLTLDRGQVPPGEVQVGAGLMAGAELLASATKVVNDPLTPPWLNDRTGITETVPAPWTPLRVGGQAREVACSGRRYRFESSLLPRGITSAGAELLAAPITLRLSRGGQAVAWQRIANKVTAAKPAAIELSGEMAAPGLTCRGTTRIEFDGMLRLDLELTPQPGQTPADGLVLEIPLPAARARYLYHFPGRWGSVANAGALPAEGWRHPWKPFVWLGDEDRGLAWWCESEENWTPANPAEAITIDRESGRVVLRLHLSEGQLLTAPRRYTFGLQATPAKQPDRDVWDYRLHHGGSYTLHTAPYGRLAEVVYPAAGHIRTDQGTFEAWIQPHFDSDPALPEEAKRKQGNRNLLTIRFADNSNAGLYWNELHQGPVVWAREAGEVTLYAGSAFPARRDEWHHLVFTWGDAVRVWLDGQLQFERAHTGLINRPAEQGQLVLGGNGADFALDELRILDHPVAPASTPGLPAAVPGTLLLEHFDRLGPGDQTAPSTGQAGRRSNGVRAVPGRFGQAVDLAGARGETTLLERLAEAGVRTVCFHEHWTPWQSHPYTSPENEPALTALTEAVHQKKMQLLLYMSRQVADTAPEYELYSEDILTLPRTFSYTRQPAQTDWGVCWRSHWREFALQNLARTMDRFGNDGWYLDGPEWPCPCTNRHHGCGYLKPDGSIGPTYDIFATREFMRRLYVLTRQRKPTGQLNIHNSTVMTIPTLVWGTSSWDGEQLGSIDRGPKFLELLPLDAIRCEMMGRQWGVPAELLCYERPWTTHELLALGLLHDVLVRPNGYDDKLDEVSSLWRLADRFGRKQARFMPYWSNGDVVRTDREAVKVSLYSKGPAGALLVVANLSDQPCTAAVTLDLKRLGLKATLAEDALARKPLAHRAGRVEVPLGAFDYRMVEVR